MYYFKSVSRWNCHSPRFCNFLPILLSSLFVSFLLISCASTPQNNDVPEWVLDCHAAFPSDTYLSAGGESATKEGSRTEAAPSLARFLKTEIETQTHAASLMNSEDNSTNIRRTLATETNLSSSVSLSNLEYTEPYYSKKQKTWYCVAYIEREKAWEQYKPGVEKAKNEFYSFYKNACGESDPFTKCAVMGKSLKSGEDFLEKLDFARILHPKKEAAYEKDRKTVSEIPALIASEKEKCTLYLAVTGDYGNIISSSVSLVLSKSGFKITKSQKEANYTANVFVETNANETEPISMCPSLDFKIESKAGKTVYAVQVKSEKKTLAYTLENAQKKAYPILAEESKKIITMELEEKISK